MHTGPQRSDSLDALRGIAIALVVASHHFGLTIGWTGPDLFFALSGFLLGGILIDNRNSPRYWQTFYGRRAFRILPLYWVFIGITALMGVMAYPLWSYLAFVQNIMWIDSGVRDSLPVAVTWTLTIEEQFYLFLPLLIRFVPLSKLPRILLALAIIAPVFRIFVAPFSSQAALLLAPGRFDTLCGGAFLAAAGRRPGRSLQSPMLICAAFSWAGLGAIVWSGGPTANAPWMFSIGFSLIAIIYLHLVLLAVTFVPKLPSWARPLAALGIGSYMIYLFSDILFAAIGDRVLASAATVMAAFASWHFFERPLIDLGRRLFSYGPIGSTSLPGRTARLLSPNEGGGTTAVHPRA